MVESTRAHLCRREGSRRKSHHLEIESAGAGNLLKAGIRKEDFIGTEVSVKGFLAKDGTPAANASSFTLVQSKKEFVSEEQTKTP